MLLQEINFGVRGLKSWHVISLLIGVYFFPLATTDDSICFTMEVKFNKGEVNVSVGINLHNCLKKLSKLLFLSLTHDELNTTGTIIIDPAWAKISIVDDHGKATSACVGSTSITVMSSGLKQF